MKRSVTSWLIFTFAAALAASGSSALAGTADVKSLPANLNATTYSVTLTGTPANQVAHGSAVTLTAKVTQLPPNTVASAATTLVDPRLRYTFKAQRTSPCAENVTITSSHSPQSTVSWNAPKAGKYTITVHVTTVHIQMPFKPRLPEVIGDGTLSYVVTAPLMGVTTAVVPASASASAPVNVTITANVPPPGYAASYKFTAYCETMAGAALPCQGVSTPSVSTPSATLPPLHLGTSGPYFIVITGEIIRQSDCEITGAPYTHISYTVN